MKRFRGFKGFREEGIAHGATAWQGSEGSEGSEGKVSPTTMSMKSALRDDLPALYVILSISEESRYLEHMRQKLKIPVGGKEPPSVALPLWCLRHHLSPQESVSLGSQVALLPYEPSSLATPLCGGHNKAPRSISLRSCSILSTGCCPLCTSCRGCASRAK